MNVPVVNLSGAQVGMVELPAEVFEAKINTGLMWQYYMLQRDNARLGTHKVKTRSEVNRTHAKWYRQKGTGRARHGSRNAPIFVGGGRSHGPIPHKYTKDMPKAMRHAALRSALSAAARDNQIIVVENLNVSEAKTKAMAAMVKALVGDSKVLILTSGRNEALERGIRNLPNAYYLHATYVNVRDLLQYERVIIPVEVIDVLKTLLVKAAPRSAEKSE